MKERVLITKAVGDVGLHLIHTALEAGLEVFVNMQPSNKLEHLKCLSVSYVNLNLADVAVLGQQLEEMQCSYIIHSVGTTTSKKIIDVVRVTAMYTKNLGIAASQAAIPLKKIIYISCLRPNQQPDLWDASGQAKCRAWCKQRQCTTIANSCFHLNIYQSKK